MVPPVPVTAEVPTPAPVAPAAPAAPVVVAPAAAPAPSRFSRANLRRVGLSALKAFAVAAGAIVVAHQGDLGNGHLALSTVQSIGLAAVVAGGDAAAKVLQVFLED